MSWLVWLAALLLVSSWLLLLSHCCRVLLTQCGGCCNRRRASRDASGRVLDCTFCCIVQHHALREQQQQQQLGLVSPSPPAAFGSAPPFDTIADPSVSASARSRSACCSPLSADCVCAHGPTVILYSTPWVLVFSPRRPAASRHLLVVPRRHIRDCKELSRERSWRTQLQQQDGEKESEKDAEEEEEVREQRKKETAGGAGSAGDEEEFKQREEEEGEETAAAASSAAASWTGVRRRGGWRDEEEKQLTACQYLDHMTQVGRLLLAQPALMTDPQGGTSNSSSRGGGSSLAHAVYSCFKRRRRRTGSRGARRRGDEADQDSQRELLADAQSASGSSSTRFCFHVPPFNSISHLHLHCLQSPFRSCRSELSFTPGTPWCKEAQQLRAELLTIEQSVYDA